MPRKNIPTESAGQKFEKNVEIQQFLLYALILRTKHVYLSFPILINIYNVRKITKQKIQIRFIYRQIKINRTKINIPFKSIPTFNQFSTFSAPVLNIPVVFISLYLSRFELRI